MQLKIEKIVYPGRSMARHQGKVIFTDDGLPGETVEAEITAEKKNFAEAKTKCVLEASPHRVLPRCGHFKICAPYQNIAYDYQVELKTGQLREILAHALKMTDPKITVRPAEKVWGYRNKIQLGVMWADQGMPFYVYHEVGQLNKFQAIGDCHLASETALALLRQVIGLLHEHRLTFISEVIVRESARDGSILLGFGGKPTGESLRSLAALAVLKEKFPLTGIVYRGSDADADTAVYGNAFLSESVMGKELGYGMHSFFQVNAPMAVKLIEDIKSLEITQKNELIDMYCGVGTFGITLSGMFRKVKACDISKDNLGYLGKNIRDNELKNITAYKGDAAGNPKDMLETEKCLLLVDPPRSGLAENVKKHIMRVLPKEIIYISCDPSTLARDLKELVKSYSVKDVFMYDFFPHTAHIETMVFLVKI